MTKIEILACHAVQSRGDHGALRDGPQQKTTLYKSVVFTWCREPGSNWRRKDFQSFALPLSYLGLLGVARLRFGRVSDTLPALRSPPALSFASLRKWGKEKDALLPSVAIQRKNSSN